MKPYREFYFCDWCKKISSTNSDNGYCQKCFESKLIQFTEHAALEAANAEIERLKAELLACLDIYQQVTGQFGDDTDKLREQVEELEKELQQFYYMRDFGVWVQGDLHNEEMEKIKDYESALERIATDEKIIASNVASEVLKKYSK